MHCRKNYWNSRYFGANFPRSNSPAIPDQELIERIDDDLREILATHRPEPLPEPVRKEIRAILGRFEGASERTLTHPRSAYQRNCMTHHETA